jgi:DNA-binding transcriptional ArsR family regulator
MKLSALEFARICKALADPQRCSILERTAAAGELSCAAIVGQCPVSQATISHHLKELTVAGLLERRKDGQFAYYRFRGEVMEAFTGELQRRMRPARARPRLEMRGRR